MVVQPGSGGSSGGVLEGRCFEGRRAAGGHAEKRASGCGYGRTLYADGCRIDLSQSIPLHDRFENNFIYIVAQR